LRKELRKKSKGDVEMIIKHYPDGSMKLHFYDVDDYKASRDGVHVWLTKVDVERIVRVNQGMLR
jgi:hypothetical protein